MCISAQVNIASAEDLNGKKIGCQAIAITPEGTRKGNRDWKLGFYYIALKAGVPIVLVSLDYKEKCISIDRIIVPNGDIDTQMAEIKAYYKGVTAKYPDKFIL